MENLEEPRMNPRSDDTSSISVKKHFCPYCSNRVGFKTEIGLENHLEFFHGIPSKSLAWLRQRTFENLIHVHLEKLNRIMRNSYGNDILSRRERRLLIREGILIVDRGKYKENKTEYRLTDEALVVLSKI